MHAQGQGLTAKAASLGYSSLQASLDPMRQLRQLVTLGKGRLVAGFFCLGLLIFFFLW
jgi:hypothetical protein